MTALFKQSFIFLLLVPLISCSQSKKKEITLPIHEIEILKNKTSAIEMTFYKQEGSISISGVNNARFIGYSIDTIAPDSISNDYDAYLLIIVNGEAYLDCEIAYYKPVPYFKFKKGDNVYYNKLSAGGINYFRQMMAGRP